MAPLRPRRQVQRRLRAAEVAELVAAYQAGATVTELAQGYGIRRQTVSAHLERQGVARRYRLLGPGNVRSAAKLYDQGWSLARLGEHFGVTGSTVRRALLGSGFKTRPRPRTGA